VSIALTILGLSVLIVLHELGHFLVARVTGMRVTRFSLGFGPRLFERQIGETRWQVAAILLGGYVQIHGMGPPDPDNPVEEDHRSYQNRPVWARAAVIFAGPAANWLLAAVLISLLALTSGFPAPDEAAVLGAIKPESPAAAAGLQTGDRVLRVDGEEVSDWLGLVSAIQAHPEEEVPFEIERGGLTMTLDVTPGRSSGDYGELGVYQSTVHVRHGLLGSVGAGFSRAWGLTTAQAGFLWDWVTQKRKGRLAGLPEIVDVGAKLADEGMEYLVGWLAGLSITLFLLNLLPVPALDGSRLLFLSVEAVRRRPVNQQVEAAIHGVGFLLLLGLILFVSVRWFFQ
jgi:regulator of sigma E protease